MPPPIALGIIGFGIMGERLLRAALAHAAESVTPVAVFDPAPEAAARLAAIAPDVRMLGSAEAVIAACECLYVATPPRLHIPLARAALAAGRAVFLEKPLATDLEEARGFVAEAEAAGARAAVNFPMASSPAVALLAEWQTALVPERLEIGVGFATWPRGWQQGAAGWLARRAEGGFTREVVSHFLFLTRRRLGPLALQEAKATYPAGDGAETALRARLTAGGVPVTLTGGVGTTAKDDHNTWVLNGAIRLRDWSFAEKLGADGAWAAPPDAMPNEKMRPLVLQRQLAGVAAMTRGEAHHLATLREALEVQEMVEAMLATA
ncbi:Gfo/Idh/MocA family oxidoreductase [Siccirubricoccus sp. KC 17139]|uniref:Gfo/Idh/MocA family oxidoreductase n=1 Tax=Siccirubricoccus soli TaxID=2899147 RepID=A0ABT1D2Z0_9PROT|nr:Gfo/Idh/MocA family oxidoreductase [Siccirubricoccus soli]MCO6416286.1 Gfo/Idh/MocA family oxidoreductase [Siccirubricoccus soli]MCP2682420.1 Gfo/Idh/MocA family oxidoreductase [Siccirubricoccus soli]